MTRQSILSAMFFGVLVISCAESIGNWEGSVDAVFRYRSQDSTTAVVEIRPGSLSEKAGLKVGDLILAVDGKSVVGTVFEGVRAALRGPVGSVARLSVKRASEVLELNVERRPAAKE
jgi:carboxyl-terminal processing protease